METELRRLSTELLEEVTEQIRQAGEEEARASTDLKIGWAEAYLEANGTIPDRKCKADLATAKLLWEAKRSEAMLRNLRDKFHAYQSSIDALRTLLVSLRSNL